MIIIIIITLLLNLIYVNTTTTTEVEGYHHHYHSWKKEHYDCYTEIKLNNDFNNFDGPIVGSGMITSKITCTEASYMEYARIQYNKTNDNFTKSILLAIINLYRDLEDSRKPSTVYLESITNSSLLVYPISFAIPEEFVLRTVPPKDKAFGRVIPGDVTTYYNMYEELKYREDMSNSLFVLTYKKGGWDCLRHYEILAAGALPLFVEINKSPNGTLTAHPKRLYERILNWPGLSLNASRSVTNRHVMEFTNLAFDMSSFDKKLYMAVSAALRQYTLNVLTTKAMAKYVLETIRSHQMTQLGSISTVLPKNILYLTHHDDDMNKGDYLTDMILHGLKKLLGDNAVTDFPKRNPLYKLDKDFNKSSEYYVNRKKLYGFGFSWAQTIDDWDISDLRNYGRIDNNIETNAYDLIILGSGHRDGYRSILNFWKSICHYYKPYQIATIDGADYHLRRKFLNKYSSCVGIIFSREGYNAFSNYND